MKTYRTIKSAATIAVLGIFLAACSGGGDSSDTARTSTNNTTVPTKKIPSVTTPVSSGPINVGASGNETIDGVAANTDQILEKLGSLENTLNQTNSNASKAKSNSAWAKWLGVGIAGAMLLQMGANGFANGKETGSVWKGLGGFVFNTRSDADRAYTDKVATEKAKEYEAVSARHRDQAAGIATRLAGASAKIGGATMAKLDDFDNKNQTRFRGLSDQVAQQDPRPALDKMNGDLHNMRTQLLADKAAAERQAAESQQQLAVTQATVTSLEAQKAQVQAQLNVANARSDATQAEKDALSRQLGELEARIVMANESAADMQRQIQVSQTTTVKAIQEYDSFSTEIRQPSGVGANFASRVYRSSLPDSAKANLVDLAYPNGRQPMAGTP